MYFHFINGNGVILGSKRKKKTPHGYGNLSYEMMKTVWLTKSALTYINKKNTGKFDDTEKC
jgi:hypothetical protein